MVRPDPVPAARALIAALPVLIEQAEAVGDPFRLGVNGMRDPLAEPQRVVDMAGRTGPITPAGQLMRRLGI